MHVYVLTRKGNVISQIQFTMSSEATRRALTRRLEAIRRSFDHQRHEFSPEQTRNLDTELASIMRHIEALRPVLPAAAWSQLWSTSSVLKTELTDWEASNTPSSSSSSTSSQDVTDDGPAGPANVRRGRPRVGLDREKVQILLNMGFTITAIANGGLLGQKIHRTTLNKYIKINRIQTPRKMYSSLSDVELSAIIQLLIVEHPNAGYREIQARLKSRDPPIIVQFLRVIRLVKILDPAGVSRRWANAILRRSYYVPVANFLWHLDTHHKIIRWKFVVHGCIDGYSRLITHLKVTTDNLASTALNFFFESTKEYGIPGRIRVDGGSEFNHIERFMNQLDGSKRCFRGKSVHNTRIERLWRDVFTKVISKYQNLFYHMENHGILNVEDEKHLYALHTVFLPRIKQELMLWRDAHNQHPVRTEKYRTPLQLWNESFITNSQSEYSAVVDVLESNANEREQKIQHFREAYDMVEPDDINIVISRIPCPLSEDMRQALIDTFNFTRESATFGIDIYGRVLQFISIATNA